jgi:hypothetical protein
MTDNFPSKIVFFVIFRFIYVVRRLIVGDVELSGTEYKEESFIIIVIKRYVMKRCTLGT